MNLDNYRRSRMIVLHQRSSAYEAARAMADNHVGSVLVADDRAIVGVVTDRDLALDIVAADAAHTTTLHDIMSDEVAALPINASVEDAVHTMCEHGCRRVPLVEDGKPVGLVTLDDLIIDGAINASDARSIIVAQLEVTARFKEEGALHPESPASPEMAGHRHRAILRRKARADTAYARLLRAVEAHSGLGSREQAELCVLIVLGMLCRRVTPDEAAQLIAQLPSKLQPELQKCLDGPDRRVTREAIELELVGKLNVNLDVAALLLTSVCESISDCITAGEIESFRGQLPLDMKDLFPPTTLRRT